MSVVDMVWLVQGAQAMFPGGPQTDGAAAAHAAAQMPLSMPEGDAMFNTNSISSKSPDQGAFPSSPRRRAPAQHVSPQNVLGGTEQCTGARSPS